MAKPSGKATLNYLWLYWEYSPPWHTNSSGPLTPRGYAKSKREYKKLHTKARRRDNKAILEAEYKQALLDMEAEYWFNFEQDIYYD